MHFASSMLIVSADHAAPLTIFYSLLYVSASAYIFSASSGVVCPGSIRHFQFVPMVEGMLIRASSPRFR